MNCAVLGRTPSCAPCASPPLRTVARCRPRNTRICLHCRNRCQWRLSWGCWDCIRLPWSLNFDVYFLINIENSAGLHLKRLTETGKNLPSPIWDFSVWSWVRQDQRVENALRSGKSWKRSVVGFSRRSVRIGREAHHERWFIMRFSNPGDLADHAEATNHHQPKKRDWSLGTGGASDQIAKVIVCLIWSQFDPHKIHIPNSK